MQNRDVLIAELIAETRTRAKTDLLTALEEKKVAASPINSVGEVFEDPQIKARGLRIEPQGIPGVRTPIVYATNELALDRSAPKLGEHNLEVRARGWDVLPQSRESLV